MPTPATTLTQPDESQSPKKKKKKTPKQQPQEENLNLKNETPDMSNSPRPLPAPKQVEEMGISTSVSSPHQLRNQYSTMADVNPGRPTSIEVTRGQLPPLRNDRAPVFPTNV